MRMHHGCMLMRMAVLGCRRLGLVVFMAVFISFVRMCVLVFNRFMQMGVDVLLAYVEPDTNSHASTCRKQPQADRFTQERKREQRPEKRCYGKIGPGSGGSKVAQADHEQGKAYTVSQPADDQGARDDGQWRQTGTRDEGQPQIHASRRQSFYRGDPGCIHLGYLAGEIVVYSPRQASAQNRKNCP